MFAPKGGVDRAAIAKLIESKKSLKLDLGCGPHKQPGTFGIDTRALPGVDLVWDLERIPWPLPDNCARFVLMSHFWEHLKPWLTLKFMAELHRVCEGGAQVLIAGPYSNEFRFVQDPTHCNPSNEATFLYWDKADVSGLWGVYQPPCFHVDQFDVLPAGGSRDFNAFLTVCKPAHRPCANPRCGEGIATAVSAPRARDGAGARGRTKSAPASSGSARPPSGVSRVRQRRGSRSV